MSERTRNWTDEQRALIELGADGLPRLKRVAVRADAGAGKTSVLVERVRCLPTEKRVLCVSFTEKSKADLEQRLSDWLNAEVYTIHGFCGRVVSEFGALLGLPPFFRILDQEESDELFYRGFEKTYRRCPPANSEHGVKTFFELCRIAHEIGPDFELCEGDDGMRAFVRDVIADYEAAKRSLRGLDYSDLELKAVELLRVPAVASTLRGRYAHVFVDEFQDTSQIQCELVNAISPNSGERGLLFVVGDGKQSIYRFRGADVRVFEEFVRRLPESRRLSSNFRSHSEVIQAVNDVSGAIIENYEPMVAARSAGNRKWDAPRVARITSEGDAEGVAAILQRLRAQGVDWSEVVLLLKRIKGNEKLFEGLRERGIGVAVSSSSSASSDESLCKLSNLWIWACEPWQKLRAAQVVTDFSEPGARARLDAKLAELSSPLAANAALSCEELLFALDLKFGLRARFGAVFEQFELFVLSHQSQGLAPSTLARKWHLKLEQGQDIDGFTLLPPPANLAGTIRVLTVHGAKGLEFPVVILADVKKRRNRSSAVFRRGNRVWLLGRDEEGELDKSSPELVAAIEQEAADERAESARLLYVAMTRAEEALYIVDRAPADSAKKKKLPEESWAAWLREGISKVIPAENFAEFGTSLQLPSTDLAHAPVSGRRLEAQPASYIKSRIGVTELASMLNEPSHLETPAGRSPSPSRGGSALSAEEARDLGVLIHAQLEHENWTGLENAANRANIDLAPFRGWLKTEIGRAVFGAGARVYREFAFEWKSSHGTVTGRIDRLVVINDEAWIIDYKVLMHSRDRRDLLASYGPQLRLYTEAVKKMTPKLKVRAFLLDVTAATGDVWHETGG